MPDGQKFNSVPAFWGTHITCYDPGYAPHCDLPTRTFDGVVCTDCLEHCPEEDLTWIVGELFSFARRFVYTTVACFLASKHLANGENAHCTVKPPEWWEVLIRKVAAQSPQVRFVVIFDFGRPGVKPAAISG